MNLLEIKQAVAGYLAVATEDLTINSVDFGLMALNQVRQEAELMHDFEFSRKLVIVTVDGVTGGSLEDAVIYGTDIAAPVKTVVDVGLFDDSGNLRPVEWTTVADSLNRQRQNNTFGVPRYPTDAQATSTILGQSRFQFSGSRVMVFPRADAESYNLGVEAYIFENEWSEDDLNAADEDIGAPWNTLGSQFLIWGAVVLLNHKFKEFVFRQEGNLPPPEKLRDTALEKLVSWDVFKFDQARRHNR